MSDPRHPAGPGLHGSGPAAAVEEIFLEGENAVILHHPAGSAQASGLLEIAEVLGEPESPEG